jgi:hypothetical protein
MNRVMGIFKNRSRSTSERAYVMPRSPAWIGPPDNELGASVPLRLVLARTETHAIIVRSVVAFSTGFEFVLSGRSRNNHAADTGDRRLGDLDADPANPFISVEFADGRIAAENHRPTGIDQSQPVLIRRGGHYSERDFDTTKWVWPLPPPGPLAFVFAWPGVAPATHHDVDASPILAAAATSELLWPHPDQAPSSPGS